MKFTLFFCNKIAVIEIPDDSVPVVRLARQSPFGNPGFGNPGFVNPGFGFGPQQTQLNAANAAAGTQTVSQSGQS